MAALLLTEAEACAQLNLCERTLRKARRSGQLPFVQIGRAVRYTLADLQAFVEGNRQWQSTKEPTPHSGGTTSPSTVVDLGEARARLASKLRKPSKPSVARRPQLQPRRTDGGASAR